MLCVRKAEISEIPAVMQFIAEHWKKDHILAVDRDFFEWMYVQGEELNFNLAVDDETGKIFGINGFILYNHEANPDMSGSMWKVLSNQSPALGLSLGEYSWERWQPRDVFSLGLNERAAKIEHLYGSETACLECWYRLGKNDGFKLAKIETIPETDFNDETGKFECIFSMDEFKQAVSDVQLKKNTPYKNYSYIEHRYFNHPVYEYQFYRVMNREETCSGVFVCREAEHDGVQVCKIIDFYGEDAAVSYSGGLWDWLLQEKAYEFIDFYCYGIAHQYLNKAGFSLLSQEDGNIIPNYFEPFERENVKIRIVVAHWPSFHLYRGDGDQDRPSIPRR